MNPCKVEIKPDIMKEKKPATMQAGKLVMVAKRSLLDGQLESVYVTPSALTTLANNPTKSKTITIFKDSDLSASSTPNTRQTPE